jgi:hypothetical protein
MLVYCNIGEHCLGHLDGDRLRRVTFGVDLDPDDDRSAAGFDDFGKERTTSPTDTGCLKCIKRTRTRLRAAGER